MNNPLPLIIPVENQVRELDSKLLLATCATKENISSYIGYRTELDIMITTLPKGIYLSKSMTRRSNKMFKILSKLGHIICAWDEEALVHYPPDIYFKRRLSPIAIQYLELLFAWGKENEDLFRSYDHFPKTLPIHKVGNPRLDLLREEFSEYFEHEIANIKNAHGKFILINTNFGNVNSHLPIHNLFLSKDSNGNYQKISPTAQADLGWNYSEGRSKFKQKILDEFLQLIPKLSEEFTDFKIVIRPHPIENHSPYEKLASKLKNVKVEHSKNVIPWLRAAHTVIHNGCTTGIEAYLCGNPAIAYTPVTSERFGDALPNKLSNCCTTENEVIETIRNKNNLNHNLSSILNDYITYNESKLCCENIIEVISTISPSIESDSLTNAYGQLLARKRRLSKRIKGLNKSSKYNQSFQELRFPSLDLTVLNNKIKLFSKIIKLESEPKIEKVSNHIFRISPG